MTAPDAWGPRLYAWLEKYWAAKGTNQNAWTDRHPGILAPTISRWRTGTVPSLQAMRALADALDMSMVDVLKIAGVVAPRELGGQVPDPLPPNIDAAIAGDPALTDFQRRTLREMLTTMRAVEAGQATVVQSPRAQASRRTKS